MKIKSKKGNPQTTNTNPNRKTNTNPNHKHNNSLFIMQKMNM